MSRWHLLDLDHEGPVSCPRVLRLCDREPHLYFQIFSDNHITMDVEGFLNIERRTGIKDSDIKGFLSKVDNVQDQLAKLMSGELAPEDVRIPGERTPEEEGKQ